MTLKKLLVCDTYRTCIFKINVFDLHQQFLPVECSTTTLPTWVFSPTSMGSLHYTVNRITYLHHFIFHLKLTQTILNVGNEFGITNERSRLHKLIEENIFLSPRWKQIRSTSLPNSQHTLMISSTAYKYSTSQTITRKSISVTARELNPIIISTVWTHSEEIIMTTLEKS